jgi:hypothetical protein
VLAGSFFSASANTQIIKKILQKNSGFWGLANKETDLKKFSNLPIFLPKGRNNIRTSAKIRTKLRQADKTSKGTKE